jgi:hypothetical protein
MLTEWVKQSQREKSDRYQFQVTEVEEISPPSESVKQHLCDVIRKDRFPVGFLEACAEELGWNYVNEELILPKLPKSANLKRGEFGETVTVLILETFSNYKVPVPKLRYKLIESQSLPATDALALKFDDRGEIAEVSFVETKLRTVEDRMAAVKAHVQLMADYSSAVPDILSFVMSRLWEMKDWSFDAFLRYMRDRKDNQDKDTFTLSLCWESHCWSEKVLENLQENGVELAPLFVYVTRINNLRQLTDEIFKELGVTEVTDDD